MVYVSVDRFPGAQPEIKDKSLWRKSNLNVANSTEEIEADARRLKRMRSQNLQDPVSSLQVNFKNSRNKYLF